MKGFKALPVRPSLIKKLSPTWSVPGTGARRWLTQCPCWWEVHSLIIKTVQGVLRTKRVWVTLPGGVREGSAEVKFKLGFSEDKHIGSRLEEEGHVRWHVKATEMRKILLLLFSLLHLTFLLTPPPRSPFPSCRLSGFLSSRANFSFWKV